MTSETGRTFCAVVTATRGDSHGMAGVGAFAPLLDGYGVKRQHCARFLSRRLGLELFVSKPGK